jgi:hypothetical protein
VADDLLAGAGGDRDRLLNGLLVGDRLVEVPTPTVVPLSGVK